MRSENNITSVIEIDYTSKSTHDRYRHFYKVLSSVNTPQQFIELIDAIRKTCISNKDAYLFFNYRTLRYKIGKKFRVFIKDFDSEDIISIFKNALAISNSAHPSKNLYKVLLTDFFREYLNLLDDDAKKLMENIIKSKEFKYLPEDFQFQLKLKLPTVNNSVEGIESSSVASVNNTTSILDELKSIDYTSKSTKARYRHFYKVLSSVNTPQQFIELIDAIRKTCISNKDAYLFFNYRTLRYKIGKKFRVFIKDFDSEDIISIFKNALAISNSAHPSKNLYKVFITDFFREYLNLLNGDAKKLMENIIKSKEFKYLPEEFQFQLKLKLSTVNHQENVDALPNLPVQLKRKLPTDIADKRSKKVAPNPVTTEVNNREKAKNCGDILAYIVAEEGIEKFGSVEDIESSSVASVNNITNILDELKSIDYTSKCMKARYRHFYKVLSSVNTPQEFIELIDAIHKVCSNNKDASHSFNNKTLRYKIGEKFRVFIKDFDSEDIISIFKNALAISTSAHPNSNLYRALLDSFKKNINLFNGDKIKLTENIIKSKEFKYILKELKDVLPQLKRKLPTDIEDKCNKKVAPNPVTTEVNDQENADALPNLPSREEFRSAEGTESSNNANSAEVSNQECADDLAKLAHDLPDLPSREEFRSAEGTESSNNANSAEVSNQEKVAMEFSNEVYNVPENLKQQSTYLIEHSAQSNIDDNSTSKYNNLLDEKDRGPEGIAYILESLSKINNLIDLNLTNSCIYSKLDLRKNIASLNDEDLRTLTKKIAEKLKYIPPQVKFTLLKKFNEICEPNDKEALKIKQKIESLLSIPEIRTSNVAKEDSVTTGDLKQQENNNELLNFDDIPNDILQDGQIYNNEDFLDNELLNSYAELACSLMRDNKEYCVW